jgi:3-hydroxyisobutyrate dehydrogenase-like beta-hydroxyacid dehydrogenase
MEKSPVTLLGLGAMGSALATALIQRGHVVTVWNRSPGKIEPLVAQGARHAKSVAAAVEASPVVVVCVLDYSAVLSMLAEAAPALAGRVVVNLTNGTPRQVREASEWVAHQGAEYVDGAIMAVPPMIGGPDALVLYSGSEKGFEAHRATLEVFGTSRFLGLDAALAAVHDLALLGGMYGMFAGFLHATALAGTVNVRAMDFVELLVPWLRSMAATLPGLARQVDARDYTIDVVSNLRMQVVAFDHILAASREQGVDPKLLEPLHALFRQRLAAGHPDEDVSGAIELIRPPASDAELVRS